MADTPDTPLPMTTVPPELSVPPELYSAGFLASTLSVPDLARQIKVTPEDVTSYIREHELPAEDKDGQCHLRYPALSEFFEGFAAKLGVEHKYYQVPEYLRNCSEPWAQTLVRMYSEKFNWPASLAPAQGELLRSLVCNLEPGCVVEIGCFTGISSVWLGSGLKQLKDQGRVAKAGVLHSVDLFNEIFPGPNTHYRYFKGTMAYAQQAAHEAGLEEINHFHKADSREMGRRIGQVTQRPIDLIFIDGDHTVEGAFHDFFLFYPQIAVGGMIVLHDIHVKTSGWRGPRYVLDTFVKNSGAFEMIEVQTEAGRYGSGHYGMALVRKVGPRRSWSRSQLRAMQVHALREMAVASKHKVAEKIDNKLNNTGNSPANSQIDLRHRINNLALIRQAARSGKS